MIGRVLFIFFYSNIAIDMRETLFIISRQFKILLEYFVYNNARRDVNVSTKTGQC